MTRQRQSKQKLREFLESLSTEELRALKREIEKRQKPDLRGALGALAKAGAMALEVARDVDTKVYRRKSKIDYEYPHILYELAKLLYGKKYFKPKE